VSFGKVGLPWQTVKARECTNRRVIVPEVKAQAARQVGSESGEAILGRAGSADGMSGGARNGLLIVVVSHIRLPWPAPQ
jgi:hypothetical protein